VVGTGIDLSTFIRNVVDSDQTGVESLFVDEGGAIQATRDAKPHRVPQHHAAGRRPRTIFHMLDRAADRTELAEMMAAARSETAPVSPPSCRWKGANAWSASAISTSWAGTTSRSWTSMPSSTGGCSCPSAPCS
jgi:hypothetical protein